MRSHRADLEVAIPIHDTLWAKGFVTDEALVTYPTRGVLVAKTDIFTTE